MKKCTVIGCHTPMLSRGYCNKHYKRNAAYGSPTTLKNRESGTGSIRTDGYVIHGTDGQIKLEHVIIAERALGKPLPCGAVVHHVDENKANNVPTNLVICPSQTYHQLIHKRMRALAASGHADWWKCTYCKQYDDPVNMRVTHYAYHLDCKRQQYYKNRVLK